jgi:TP901 family phage tail tape measure protein
MASRTEYQLAIKIAGLIDSSLGSSCNLTKKQLKEIAKAASDASGKTVTFSQAMQNVAPEIDAAWSGLKTVVKTGAAALTAAGTAAVAVGKAAVDVGSDFDKAMSSWKGTAAATDAEYQVAREAAMKWGRETTKTATEGANALEYMALAGWNVTDSVAALPRILKLSEATDLDLARTSDLVTDSMSATGETIGENGDNLERFLNVATKANNKSNQTAEDLMEAWIETGGVFKNLGVDIEDSATALGVLANRGIKGSEAGTALNAVMVNLTTGTGQAGTMMKKLGLSAFDQNGNFKGLKQTLTELNEKVSTMTQEEQNAALAAIGGKMHVDALNDLLSGLNTTVADGSTEWDNLNEELRDANGSLDQMASTKMDNLWGDQQILTSALQDAGIRLNDGLTAPLREATQAATELVYKAGDIADTLEYQYPTIKRVLKEGASSAEGFAQPLLKLGEFVVNNPEAFAGIATGLASSITILKGGKELSKVPEKLMDFVARIGSSSGSLLLGGAALVAGGTVAAATATKIANMRKQTRSLKSHFGDVTLSLEDLSEAAENIIGKQTFERFSASVEQLDKVKELKEDLDDTGESIDRIVWKVQAGVDLSDSDKSTLEASIDSLVKESQEYITEKQYSLNLSVNALFGDGSTAGDSILSSMSGFYDNLNEDVAALGKELGDVYSEALEDGIIDVDEANTIQSLKERLQEITNGVENAKFEGTLAGIAGKYSGRNLDSDTFQNLQSELNETVETQQENIYQNMYSLLGDLQQQYNYSQSGKIKPGEAGYLTEAEFKEQQEQITSATNQQSAETEAKALGFSADTIAESYKSEIEAFSKRIPELTQQAMSDLQGGDTPDSVIFSNLNNIDKGDQLAIQKLVENVKPSIEELKESVSGLDTVPESIQAVFDEFELLEAAGGDTASIISLMAKQLGTEEERDALIASAKRAGFDIPNNIAKGVKENAGVVSQTVNSSFGSLSVDTTVDVGVNLGTITGLAGIRTQVWEAANNALAPTLRTPSLLESIPIPQKANGDVVNSPTIAEIGEGGDTEFVIPINGKKRSADLWRAAGEQLGAVNSAVNNSEKVVFSPVINVSGGASESMVRRAINESYQTFESMIAEYEKTQRRVSM